MKIYLATWVEAGQAVALTRANYARRLMSFHFIRDGKMTDEQFVSHSKTGIWQPMKKGKRDEN